MIAVPLDQEEVQDLLENQEDKVDKEIQEMMDLGATKVCGDLIYNQLFNLKNNNSINLTYYARIFGIGNTHIIFITHCDIMTISLK